MESAEQQGGQGRAARARGALAKSANLILIMTVLLCAPRAMVPAPHAVPPLPPVSSRADEGEPCHGVCSALGKVFRVVLIVEVKETGRRKLYLKHIFWGTVLNWH